MLCHLCDRSSTLFYLVLPCPSLSRYSPDLGRNSIFVYSVDYPTGKLTRVNEVGSCTIVQMQRCTCAQTGLVLHEEYADGVVVLGLLVLLTVRDHVPMSRLI